MRQLETEVPDASCAYSATGPRSKQRNPCQEVCTLSDTRGADVLFPFIGLASEQCASRPDVIRR